MYRSISVLDVKVRWTFFTKQNTACYKKKKHFKILYYIYNCILFFFLFTLVDLLNYYTMTFINYTCIYIYRPICIRVCPSRIDFFFVWQMRLWILQMVCDALITCNNLIFVPCDCSGSVFANLLLPIMLLNINGC